jgi:hypothetical protein
MRALRRSRYLIAAGDLMNRKFDFSGARSLLQFIKLRNRCDVRISKSPHSAKPWHRFDEDFLPLAGVKLGR